MSPIVAAVEAQEAGMPNYRRAWVPGGAWFFTVNLLQRHGTDLLVREIELLRHCVAVERARRPFSVLAWVVLPDHMHWIWRLPVDDHDFATRWRRIRTDFSLGVPRVERPSAVRRRRGERRIWQRRYWEHLIRDDIDLRRHVDYIHHNPVKHGWAKTAADWPHSSFHAFVQRGLLRRDWAASSQETSDVVGRNPKVIPPLSWSPDTLTAESPSEVPPYGWSSS